MSGYRGPDIWDLLDLADGLAPALILLCLWLLIRRPWKGKVVR